MKQLLKKAFDRMGESLTVNQGDGLAVRSLKNSVNVSFCGGVVLSAMASPAVVVLSLGIGAEKIGDKFDIDFLKVKEPPPGYKMYKKGGFFEEWESTELSDIELEAGCVVERDCAGGIGMPLPACSSYRVCVTEPVMNNN